MATHRNGYRPEKRGPNKEIWLQLQASPEYRAGLQERNKIERKFGEARQKHGLRSCRRYLGLLRCSLHVLLVATVPDLKRMVKLLVGARSQEPVLVTGRMR